MIDAVETALTDMGVPQPLITSERFRYSYGPRSPTARRLNLRYAAVLAVALAAAVVFTAIR